MPKFDVNKPMDPDQMKQVIDETNGILNHAVVFPEDFRVLMESVDETLAELSENHHVCPSMIIMLGAALMARHGIGDELFEPMAIVQVLLNHIEAATADEDEIAAADYRRKLH